MAQFKRDLSTYQRFRSRQWEDRWGRDYVAAIHATPIEAPSNSFATIQRPAKLGGREFHTLSHGETWASWIAFHHPNVWDVHEQRILYPTPRPHFLAGHPRAVGMSFPPFRGTVAVAEEMGILARHPKLRLTDGDGQPYLLPFFYLGDILVFLEDEDGPYAVNWTIKDKAEAFRKRRSGPSSRACPRRAGEEDDERHELERLYYLDAGIRTVRVTADVIPKHLWTNLRVLIHDLTIPVLLPESDRRTVVEVFRRAVGSHTPATDICRQQSRLYGISERSMHALLRQAIWSRELRIDLFQPYHPAQPLRPERCDPTIINADWFRR